MTPVSLPPETQEINSPANPVITPQYSRDKRSVKKLLIAGILALFIIISIAIVLVYSLNKNTQSKKDKLQLSTAQQNCAVEPGQVVCSSVRCLTQKIDSSQFCYSSTQGNIYSSSFKILVGNAYEYKVLDLYGNILKKVDTDLEKNIIDKYALGSKKYSPETGHIVSPDGTKVAMMADLSDLGEYTASSASRFAIYVYSYTSGKVSKISPLCGVGITNYRIDWGWSSNSKYVVIASCDKNEYGADDLNPQVIKVDTDTNLIVSTSSGYFHSINGDGSINVGTKDQVQDRPDSFYVISPNSRYKFKFVRRADILKMKYQDVTGIENPLRDFNGIQVFDMEGNLVVQTPRVATQGSGKWSPNSKYILYANRNDGVYILDVERRKEFKVASITATFVSWYTGM